jgi:DMSO/TMAO reductase YedYZ molybdopterin-dependent catalytic subunit
VLTRRKVLLQGAGALGALALSGCDRLSQAPSFREFLMSVEDLTRYTQRLLLSPATLAREFTEADLSPSFKANGTVMPGERSYQTLFFSAFSYWRLQVDGMVNQPLRLSLAELRALPARTQITRHDCVEGWSCIGKWSGPQLGTVLAAAGLKDSARFIVFHCADSLDRSLSREFAYYESIDLVDAFHPQTILAHEMNGEPLSIAHGAPLRLRVERQLGYKMAKYVMRIEVVESLAGIGRGRGGYWEDRGYEWYTGI